MSYIIATGCQFLSVIIDTRTPRVSISRAQQLTSVFDHRYVYNFIAVYSITTWQRDSVWITATHAVVNYCLIMGQFINSEIIFQHFRPRVDNETPVNYLICIYQSLILYFLLRSAVYKLAFSVVDSFGFQPWGRVPSAPKIWNFDLTFYISYLLCQCDASHFQYVMCIDPWWSLTGFTSYFQRKNGVLKFSVG